MFIKREQKSHPQIKKTHKIKAENKRKIEKNTKRHIGEMERERPGLLGDLNEQTGTEHKELAIGRGFPIPRCMFCFSKRG